VFFEPKTKYIWEFGFCGRDGTLSGCTGDKGQIYAVAPDGKSELFLFDDEAHIRVLALSAGKFNCGTEPSGRVLRPSPKSQIPDVFRLGSKHVLSPFAETL